MGVKGRAAAQPAVIIYKDRLLPGSQTFVLAQAESLERFTPYYVGARLVHQGLPLPNDRSFVMNRGDLSGKVREFFFRSIGLAPRLMRQLGQLDPVLVHAHFGPDGLSGLRLARAFEIPLVVSHHGYDVTIGHNFPVSLAHRRYLARKRQLQRGADLFLAVSNFIKQQLLKQGFPEERIRVHYVGVDTTTFHPLPGIQREPIVLFVGRLVENKGCTFLLRAMAKVQQQCPQARLVIIGEGALRKQLEIEAASTVRNCSFIGQQPHQAVREWMARSSAFCVPCVTARNGASEAFGLVFIEAQAMGLPAVSFASGGVSEAIADGVSGFVVPTLDTDALSARLLQLLSEQPLWSRFSEAGVQRVQSRFSLKTQTAELETLYEQVLANYRKPAFIQPTPRRSTANLATHE